MAVGVEQLLLVVMPLRTRSWAEVHGFVFVAVFAAVLLEIHPLIIQKPVLCSPLTGQHGWSLTYRHGSVPPSQA